MDDNGASTEDEIRHSLTKEQRLADLDLTIDPGFVNHRLIETVLPDPAVGLIHKDVHSVPAMPEGLRRGPVDRIYSDAVLLFARHLEVPSLGSLLAAGRGRIFSSIVEIEATPEVYTEARAHSRIVAPGFEKSVILEYSTDKIGADTTRLDLSLGGPMAVVALFNRIDGETLIFRPLVMGAPWLLEDESGLISNPEWLSYDFFEIFVEDFDEFARTKDVATPGDFGVMALISERAFKICLTEILGDEPSKDWGGETSDHFSAHVHLRGRRSTAAFLLKGPGSRFAPMSLNHLGKNNDQIVRLAKEPAHVLVVQHCHAINTAVRETLRAFAVRPMNWRRYCLIDGRDSLRLLQAYNKLDRAMELSEP